MTELDDKIIEAIRYEKIITRDSEDIEKIFCDEQTYKEFKASDTNMIVIAPRGYGKTAYFKLFDIECRQKFKEDRNLTIFIKVDYIYQSLKARYKHVETNVLQAYLIIKTIELFLEKLGIEDKNKLKRMNLSLITKKEYRNTIDILKELRNLKDQILKFKVDIKEISKKHKKIGIGGSLPTPLPSLELKYENDKGERIERFEIDSSQGNFFHFRDFMNQLLKLLDINLFIMYDEFSEVDAKNQKNLFQFIKHLSEGTRIKSKIAIIPPKYHYYTGQGDDPIFDPINRDAREIYLISRFYNNVNIHKEILQKRFDFKNVDIKVNDLFVSMDLCDLCWKMSMSNPRDFLNLIDKAFERTRLKKGTPHKVIDKRGIKRAIEYLGDTSFVNIQFHNKNALNFLSIILIELKKKNTTKENKKKSFANAFLRFISERAIIKDPNYLRDFVLHKIIYSTHEREGKSKNINEGWEYVLNFIYALKNGVFGGSQYISENDIASLKFKPMNRIYVPIKIESELIEGKRKCPSCGFMVNLDFNFCPKCGQPFELAKPQPEEEIVDDEDDVVIMNLEDSQAHIKGWGDKLTNALYQDNVNTIIEFVDKGLDYFLKNDNFKNFRSLKKIFNLAEETIKNNL